MPNFSPENDPAIPDGLPSWLRAFLGEAAHETHTLDENGAHEAAAARSALIRKLLASATAWLDTELDATDAARESGRCPETIRRAVRSGAIPDRRANGRGRHRIRRRDLDRIAASPDESYDPVADAQDIARHRREL